MLNLKNRKIYYTRFGFVRAALTRSVDLNELKKEGVKNVTYNAIDKNSYEVIGHSTTSF